MGSGPWEPRAAAARWRSMFLAISLDEKGGRAERWSWVAVGCVWSTGAAPSAVAAIATAATPAACRPHLGCCDGSGAFSARPSLLATLATDCSRSGDRTAPILPASSATRPLLLPSGTGGAGPAAVRGCARSAGGDALLAGGAGGGAFGASSGPVRLGGEAGCLVCAACLSSAFSAACRAAADCTAAPCLSQDGGSGAAGPADTHRCTHTYTIMQLWQRDEAAAHRHSHAKCAAV